MNFYLFIILLIGEYLPIFLFQFPQPYGIVMDYRVDRLIPFGSFFFDLVKPALIIPDFIFNHPDIFFPVHFILFIRYRTMVDCIITQFSLPITRIIPEYLVYCAIKHFE